MSYFAKIVLLLSYYIVKAQTIEKTRSTFEILTCSSVIGGRK